jgi:hypothetical protein
MIGNGHTQGVTTQIAQHLKRATESGLGIDHTVMAVQAADQFRELRRVGQSRCWAGAV